MAFDKFSAEQWVGALRGDEQDFMRQGDGKSSREKHPAVARVGGQSQQSSCMKWPPTCRLRREAGATEMERMKDTLWMCDVKNHILACLCDCWYNLHFSGMLYGVDFLWGDCKALMISHWRHGWGKWCCSCGSDPRSTMETSQSHKIAGVQIRLQPNPSSLNLE